jgi:hypothetical protein
MAGLGLSIQSMRDARRPAHFAQLQNFDLKLATFRGYSQQVANMNIAGRLAWLPVGPNPT